MIIEITKGPLDFKLGKFSVINNWKNICPCNDETNTVETYLSGISHARNVGRNVWSMLHEQVCYVFLFSFYPVDQEVLGCPFATALSREVTIYTGHKMASKMVPGEREEL